MEEERQLTLEGSDPIHANMFYGRSYLVPRDIDRIVPQVYSDNKL